jgi:hypothetical protein
MRGSTPARLCAHCAGTFLAYAASYLDQSYYCPRCLPIVISQREKEIRVGGLVHVHADNISKYVILSLDPDGMMTVRKLGFPDSMSFPMHRNNVDLLY